MGRVHVEHGAQRLQGPFVAVVRMNTGQFHQRSHPVLVVLDQLQFVPDEGFQPVHVVTLTGRFLGPIQDRCVCGLLFQEFIEDVGRCVQVLEIVVGQHPRREELFPGAHRVIRHPPDEEPEVHHLPGPPQRVVKTQKPVRGLGRQFVQAALGRAPIQYEPIGPDRAFQVTGGMTQFTDLHLGRTFLFH